MPLGYGHRHPTTSAVATKASPSRRPDTLGTMMRAATTPSTATPTAPRRSLGLSGCISHAATGGSAFAHSDSGATGSHPDLDPYGLAVRESRDSAEHPRSVAIAVLFDVTGSMREVPRTLQAKLPQLLGLLLRKGYVADPQIMFGAIGDATCDRAPLQAGAAQAGARVPGGVPEEITAAQATCILQSAKPSGTAGQEYLTRA